MCVGDYCSQLLHLLVGTTTQHACQGRLTICQCKHDFVLWADGRVSIIFVLELYGDRAHDLFKDVRGFWAVRARNARCR